MSAYVPRVLPEPRNPHAVPFAQDMGDFLYDAEPGRLSRGRGYARSGVVGEFELDEGFAATEVAGSRGSYYSVELHITPFGEMSGRCDCPDSHWICKHIVAACIALVDLVDRDVNVLNVLRGMAFPEPVHPQAPEGAGITRWAADAYDDGPSAADAFARVPADLPEPPPLPAAPEHPCFHAGPYDPGQFTDEIDADRLDLQAAIAANSAFNVLDEAARGLEVHPRPADLELDAARIASSTAGLIPQLAQAIGCSQAEMGDRARAWMWGGAEAIATLTGQWKPEPAVCKAADERLTDLFGQTTRRLNRWTIPSLNLQLRLAEDGRWYPYAKTGNRWTPAGPPTSDPETAVRAVGR
jgi:hypothetical protein